MIFGSADALITAGTSALPRSKLRGYNLSMTPPIDNQRRQQRLHDLNAVHTDFKSVVILLKSGYKFDDENAPDVIKQLEHALSLLKYEIERQQKDDPGADT